MTLLPPETDRFSFQLELNSEGNQHQAPNFGINVQLVQMPLDKPMSTDSGVTSLLKIFKTLVNESELSPDQVTNFQTEWERVCSTMSSSVFISELCPSLYSVIVQSLYVNTPGQAKLYEVLSECVAKSVRFLTKPEELKHIIKILTTVANSPETCVRQASYQALKCIEVQLGSRLHQYLDQILRIFEDLVDCQSRYYQSLSCHLFIMIFHVLLKEKPHDKITPLFETYTKLACGTDEIVCKELIRTFPDLFRKLIASSSHNACESDATNDENQCPVPEPFPHPDSAENGTPESPSEASPFQQWIDKFIVVLKKLSHDTTISVRVNLAQTLGDIWTVVVNQPRFEDVEKAIGEVMDDMSDDDCWVVRQALARGVCVLSIANKRKNRAEMILSYLEDTEVQVRIATLTELSNLGPELIAKHWSVEEQSEFLETLCLRCTKEDFESPELQIEWFKYVARRVLDIAGLFSYSLAISKLYSLFTALLRKPHPEVQLEALASLFMKCCSSRLIYFNEARLPALTSVAKSKTMPECCRHLKVCDELLHSEGFLDAIPQEPIQLHSLQHEFLQSICTFESCVAGEPLANCMVDSRWRIRISALLIFINIYGMLHKDSDYMREAIRNAVLQSLNDPATIIRNAAALCAGWLVSLDLDWSPVLFTALKEFSTHSNYLYRFNVVRCFKGLFMFQRSYQTPEAVALIDQFLASIVDLIGLESNANVQFSFVHYLSNIFQLDPCLDAYVEMKQRCVSVTRAIKSQTSEEETRLICQRVLDLLE